MIYPCIHSTPISRWNIGQWCRHKRGGKKSIAAKRCWHMAQKHPKVHRYIPSLLESNLESQINLGQVLAGFWTDAPREQGTLVSSHGLYPRAQEISPLKLPLGLLFWSHKASAVSCRLPGASQPADRRSSWNFCHRRKAAMFHWWLGCLSKWWNVSQSKCRQISSDSESK